MNESSISRRERYYNYFALVMLVLVIFACYFEYIQARKQKETALAPKQEAQIEIAAPVNASDPLLMSVAELRSFGGFENMNEAEAREYIYSMQQFCTITYYLYQQGKTQTDEKQS